jgi:hypothetical protein
MSADIQLKPMPGRIAARVAVLIALLMGVAGLAGVGGGVPEAAATALAALPALAVAGAGGAGPLPQPIDRQSLCVTTGEVRGLGGGRLSVDAPKVRAVVTADSPQAAELRFSYLGPTAETAALGSGELRRQLGLKLLAADSCNLVYVMWRLAPQSKIVVSTKTNPGQHTHAECGTRGYSNLKPLGKSRMPRLPDVALGSSHSLRAELAGRDLRVWADGAPAWQGTLGPEAAELYGTVGLRTDNVRLDFQLLVGGGPPGPLSRLPDRQRHKCLPATEDD